MECEGNKIMFGDYLDATCSRPAQIPTGVFKNNGACALAPPASQRLRQGYPQYLRYLASKAEVRRAGDQIQIPVCNLTVNDGGRCTSLTAECGASPHHRVA